MQMIGLKDYEGFNLGGLSFNQDGARIGGGGFGSVSPADLADLNKALTAGYQNPGTDGGAALRVQSLETILRYLTFNTEHIQLWKDVPKLPAFSTNIEYGLVNSYGPEVGSFTAEGDPGQVIDGNFERKNAFIKFMAVQGEVTQVAMLVRPAHGPVIALVTKNVTTQLLKNIEQSLFFARQDTIPLAYDGFDQQLRTDSVAGAAASPNIIDLRGKTITMDDIENGSNTVVEATGRASVMYMASKALSSIASQYQNKERVALPQTSDGLTVGTPIRQFMSNAGLINLKSNYFLRSGKVNGVKRAPSAASSTRAPTAPTIALAANAGPTPLSQFDVAGAYNFKVTALNSWGESAASASSAVTLVTAGDSATITITDGGGSFPATGYRVYRVPTAAGGAGAEQFAYDVPRIGAAATTATTDTNRFIPGTSRAYLMQMNTEAMAVNQLAPMMKIPMATQAISVRWAQVIYLVPILYAPQKMVIFDNVLDD